MGYSDRRCDLAERRLVRRTIAEGMEGFEKGSPLGLSSFLDLLPLSVEAGQLVETAGPCLHTLSVYPSLHSCQGGYTADPWTRDLGAPLQRSVWVLRIPISRQYLHGLGGRRALGSERLSEPGGALSRRAPEFVNLGQTIHLQRSRHARCGPRWQTVRHG
jgi:hypothetical protein